MSIVTNQISFKDKCNHGRKILHNMYKEKPDELKGLAQKYFSDAAKDRKLFDTSAAYISRCFKTIQFHKESDQYGPEERVKIEKDQTFARINSFLDQVSIENNLSINDRECVKKYLQYKYIKKSHQGPEYALSMLEGFINDPDIKVSENEIIRFMNYIRDGRFLSLAEIKSKKEKTKPVVEISLDPDLIPFAFRSLEDYLGKTPAKNNFQLMGKIQEIKQKISKEFPNFQPAIKEISDFAKANFNKTMQNEIDGYLRDITNFLNGRLSSKPSEPTSNSQGASFAAEMQPKEKEVPRELKKPLLNENETNNYEIFRVNMGVRLQLLWDKLNKYNYALSDDKSNLVYKIYRAIWHLKDEISCKRIPRETDEQLTILMDENNFKIDELDPVVYASLKVEKDYFFNNLKLVMQDFKKLQELKAKWDANTQSIFVPETPQQTEGITPKPNLSKEELKVNIITESPKVKTALQNDSSEKIESVIQLKEKLDLLTKDLARYMVPLTGVENLNIDKLHKALWTIKSNLENGTYINLDSDDLKVLKNEDILKTDSPEKRKLKAIMEYINRVNSKSSFKQAQKQPTFVEASEKKNQSSAAENKKPKLGFWGKCKALWTRFCNWLFGKK